MLPIWAAVARHVESRICSQDSALPDISTSTSTTVQDTAPALSNPGMPRWTPGLGVLPLGASAGPMPGGTAACAGGSGVDGMNLSRACIGAMTLVEHVRCSERDAALQRRSQPVLPLEPTQADARDTTLPCLQVLPCVTILQKSSCNCLANE